MSDEFRAGLLSQDEKTPVSFIRACQDFFSMGEHGRKITIPEFKDLTQKDKDELRSELIREGFHVTELVVTTE